MRGVAPRAVSVFNDTLRVRNNHHNHEGFTTRAVHASLRRLIDVYRQGVGNNVISNVGLFVSLNKADKVY